jgi:uncharacterized protein YceK
MKNRFRMLAIVSAVTLLLGGCGTPLYDLTDDEESLIVSYAAYALSKHNVYQQDGMTSAQLPEEQETQQQEVHGAADTPEQESSETSSSTTTESTGNNLNEEAVSLAAAIGQGSGLTVSYKGYQVQDSYQEVNYYAVDPDIGNRLVVMKFKLKNPTNQDIKLDTVSLDNTFYASFDGGSAVKETVSFGAQSLSYYEGVIKAGKSKTAVLLFQVPEAEADQISTVDLMVELEGATHPVEI